MKRILILFALCSAIFLADASVAHAQTGTPLTKVAIKLNWAAGDAIQGSVQLDKRTGDGDWQLLDKQPLSDKGYFRTEVPLEQQAQYRITLFDPSGAVYKSKSLGYVAVWQGPFAFCVPFTASRSIELRLVLYKADFRIKSAKLIADYLF